MHYIKITASLSFGNGPWLITAAHVERGKGTFFSCTFTQQKSLSWLQFIGGQFTLFGPSLRLFSSAYTGLVRVDFYQDQFI